LTRIGLSVIFLIMINLRDLKKETKCTRDQLYDAINRCGIQPVTEKPKRYLLTERESEKVKFIIGAWMRGKRPRVNQKGVGKNGR